MLIARWVGPDGARWTLPGGGLDFGEDPRAGTLRELYEETGYRGRLDALLGVDAQHLRGLRGDDFHSVRILYRATIVGGTLTHEVNGSTDRAEWVPIDLVHTLDAVALVEVGRRLATEPGVLLDPPFALPSVPPPPPPGDDGTTARLAVRVIVCDDASLLQQPIVGDVDHGEPFESAVRRAVRDSGLPAVEIVRLADVHSAVVNTGDEPEWTITMTYEVGTAAA
jgi:ADP-ribose pyrophosphatase YjhB (NUDIX family)